MQAAKEFLKDAPRASVEIADFFEQLPTDHAGRYSLGYDCTFLCAIPVEKRQAWAKAWKALLQPGGELVTLIFPVAKDTDPADGNVGSGPPFLLSLKLVQQLLEPLGFSQIDAQEVPANMVARGSSEIIARWRASD